MKVASQLPDTLNQAFARASGVTILAVDPTDLPNLPSDIEVLLTGSIRTPGATEKPVPVGWPFGLKWVQLSSVGIDAYPPWLFDGVTVTAARGASAVALAEFALASILGVAKRFPDIWIRAAEEWHPQPLTMVQGQVLGIIGFGALGTALAPRAQALGLRVLATRRSTTPFNVPGVERVDSLEGLFATADHIVLAAPATPETRNLVNSSVLAHAKPGLHLINLARGWLIDDDALLAALDAGRVFATLDVTEPEPLPPGHPYYRHPKVRLSPHTSAHSARTLENLVDHFVGNLHRFRTGLPLQGLVDFTRGY